jgi:hypothetical protein
MNYKKWEWAVPIINAESLAKILVGLSAVLAAIIVGPNWTMAQVIKPIFTFSGSADPSIAGLTPVMTEGGVRLGPLRVHPALGYGAAFSDNVFATRKNKENDVVHIIAPALQVHIPLQDHQFVLDYRANRIMYQEFSQNDGTFQGGAGQLNLRFPGGLTADLQGKYVKGFDPRGSIVDVGARDVNKWNTNSFTGQAEYFENWAGIRLNVESVRYNFENNNQSAPRDRETNSADLTLFGNITPKTSILLSFGAAEATYDRNTQQDNFSYTITTGFALSPTGKTSGEIQFGYQSLRFDNAPKLQTDPRLSSGGSNSEIFRVSGNLKWQATPKLSLTFEPFRRIRQGAPVTFAAQGGSGSGAFTSTGFNLQARQTLGNRTTLSGNFNYVNEDFSEPVLVGGRSEDRTDNVLFGRLELLYKTRQWLGVGVTYFFRQRHSTINNFEFTANTMMLSIQGKL